MKYTKHIALLAALLFASLSLRADERTFAAGSLLIPMDSIHQNTNEDGIFLAYGLVYQLLGQGIVIYSIVDENKTVVDDPDLIVDTGAIEIASGSGFEPGPISGVYLGGPFMVDSSQAATVLEIINQTPELNRAMVHRFTGPVSAPVAETYEVQPKKIALLESFDDDGRSITEDVLVCYLRLAGVPPVNYDILTASEIAGGALTVASYYILWMPHYELGDQADPVTAEAALDAIAGFADDGGNVLATCRAIDSLEAYFPLMSSHTLGVNGTQVGDITYDHLNIPFSQIGDYPFIPDPTNDTQNMRNYRAGDILAEGTTVVQESTWRPNVNVIAKDETPDHPWTYYDYRRKDDDPGKGNLHYIAGHQYASCQPTIIPGQVYRMATTMSSCEKGKGSKTAFWDTSKPCIRITLEYDGGDESISIQLCKGDYTEVVGNEFRLWTEDPNADPDRFGTNYGPGCQGGGSPQGTDHLDGIFIQNLTNNANIIIRNIAVEWSCNGFSSSSNTGCSDTYEFEQFDIKTDNGNCGNSSCDQCTDVTGNSQVCDSDGSISFQPVAKRKSDLVFDGGVASNESGDPLALNVGGIRYILNTLLNNIVNPVQVDEFSRSGPVASEGFVYNGTFEYPGNAGHFRAYEITGEDQDLTLAWDSADGIPAFVDRNLFTFINGSRVPVDPDYADVIEQYIADPTDTVLGVAENIRAFRGKYRTKRLGGIERSTPAIVPPNERANPDREALAYVGTTFGVLQMLRLSDGSEFGGYVPAAILDRLEYTNPDNPNRPKVDSSPVVLDAFLPNTPGDFSGPRSWRTVIIAGHGSNAPGISALDITDPQNVTLLWDKFNLAGLELYGNSHRVSVGRYRKGFTDPLTGADVSTLAYSAVVSSNLPSGNGVQIYAFDLQTGTPIWTTPFRVDHPSPVENQNDIPAAVAIWDPDNDGFDDEAIIGDLGGRLWRLDLEDGTNITGLSSNGTPVPYYNTLPGTTPSTSARPIAASSTLGFYEDKPVVAFGTGGTDWADATNNQVIVWSLEDGEHLIPPIDIGARKLFAPVVIANNQIFFIAVAGSLNSPDPTLDLPQVGEPETRFYAYSMNPDITASERLLATFATSKTRSPIYIKDGQVYTDKFDADSTSDGGLPVNRRGEYNPGESIDILEFMFWKDLTNEIPNQQGGTTGGGTTGGL